MMKFRENEDAVSPVIGVILMVAITVILAAVIAAFVFGMSGNVQTTKTVSMTSKLDADNITIVVNGGPDLSSLQELTITVNGQEPGIIYAKDGAHPLSADMKKFPLTPANYTTTNGSAKGDATSFKVGDTIKLKPNSGRILVVGKWADGGEQIIIDHTY